MGKFEPPSPTLLMYKRLWMTTESKNWTTAQLWEFLRTYMTSMRCLRYGHKEKRNYFDKKVAKVYYWTISNNYFVYLNSWLCVLMIFKAK